MICRVLKTQKFRVPEKCRNIVTWSNSILVYAVRFLSKLSSFFKVVLGFPSGLFHSRKSQDRNFSIVCGILPKRLVYVACRGYTKTDILQNRLLKSFFFSENRFLLDSNFYEKSFCLNILKFEQKILTDIKS